MSEEAGNYEGDFGSIAERQEQRELFPERQRKPQSEEEWILFDLAGRYDVDKAPPVSFLEAMTLIKAVETDIETRGGWMNGHDDILEHPKSLELTQRALAKASEGTENFTRGELRIARAYFNWKKEHWTETNEDFPPDYADKMRRIYSSVLRQLNEKMPVPESILPISPSEPEFTSTNRILNPLFNEDPATGEATVKKKLTKKDVIDCVTAYKDDIEDQEAPIGVMTKAIDEARTFFKAEGTEPDNRVCVVILSPNEQTVEIAPYEKGKQYSQYTADGLKQFVLDMTIEQRYTNDGLYIQGIDSYDHLKASAQRAIPAVERLMDDPPEIDFDVFKDVIVFRDRLVKAVNFEDQIQMDALGSLIGVLDKRLRAAKIVRQRKSAPKPEIQEAN